MKSLVVRSERVVLPDGVRAATIRIEDGRIVRIAPHDERPASAVDIDADDLVVMPGLVDTHVHLNDPGRADWEGFETGTMAAAAGGVTTVVDMPLNSIPPTTTIEGLHAKRAAAAGRCSVDVALWGGVVPGNAGELEALARGGVRGFKCFMAPSGVDEFPHVGEKDLREAMTVLQTLGLPLLAHAESPDYLFIPDGDPRVHDTWRRSRPPAAEQAAIELLVRLSREFRTHVHVVHVASAEALDVIRSARAEGIRITAETCPHYLTFAAEDIPERGTVFKCAPPIREREQQHALWKGLRDGDLDLVATDHSPAPPSIKRVKEGDFLKAWGGIASLQFGLAATWTGATQRGFTIEHMARWMATAPARLAGLSAMKGTIAPGADADLVIWDPNAHAVVDPVRILHRHSLTPYADMRLRGVVKTTILRGEVVFEHGRIVTKARGKMIGSAA